MTIHLNEDFQYDEENSKIYSSNVFTILTKIKNSRTYFITRDIHPKKSRKTEEKINYLIKAHKKNE